MFVTPHQRLFPQPTAGTGTAEQHGGASPLRRPAPLGFQGARVNRNASESPAGHAFLKFLKKLRAAWLAASDYITCTYPPPGRTSRDSIKCPQVWDGHGRNLRLAYTPMHFVNLPVRAGSCLCRARRLRSCFFSFRCFAVLARAADRPGRGRPLVARV